ncbi:uncharacterized protein DDB_G0290685-like [Mercenaria mercenaria]|uniref:uncharacterized protein DDB_G0290685-like n=1 Tax=Mercenaria mercenaria TaxID=6596 RepID=UPI00234F5343|nr:uncharacterized protein DDB_G0290685-like [Mercenaria mercenaria]
MVMIKVTVVTMSGFEFDDDSCNCDGDESDDDDVVSVINCDSCDDDFDDGNGKNTADGLFIIDNSYHSECDHDDYCGDADDIDDGDDDGDSDNKDADDDGGVNGNCYDGGDHDYDEDVVNKDDVAAGNDHENLDVGEGEEDADDNGDNLNSSAADEVFGDGYDCEVGDYDYEEADVNKVKAIYLKSYGAMLVIINVINDNFGADIGNDRNDSNRVYECYSGDGFAYCDDNTFGDDGGNSDYEDIDSNFDAKDDKGNNPDGDDGLLNKRYGNGNILNDCGDCDFRVGDGGIRDNDSDVDYKCGDGKSADNDSDQNNADGGSDSIRCDDGDNVYYKDVEDKDNSAVCTDNNDYVYNCNDVHNVGDGDGHVGGGNNDWDDPDNDSYENVRTAGGDNDNDGDCLEGDIIADDIFHVRHHPFDYSGDKFHDVEYNGERDVVDVGDGYEYGYGIYDEDNEDDGDDGTSNLQSADMCSIGWYVLPRAYMCFRGQISSGGLISLAEC